MNNEKKELYKGIISHTSKFTFCGNSFRADTYRGCNFGCKYCFANNRSGNFNVKNEIGAIHLAEKWFKEAIIDKDISNIRKEMLNKKVPLHLGGMSDPFQTREWKYGITKEFIKLSNKYEYPVNFSSKTAHLPDEYFELLNPKIHTFQISIMGYSDEYISKFETNTPTAKERIAFARKLKDKGFWVGIRIQPLLDINEVLELVRHIDFVDYITIEHLKLPQDNNKMMNILVPLITNIDISLIQKGNRYEFDATDKLNNVKRVKGATDVKVGCGDNEFHHLSDSLNCCGIDTMPKAFGNWLKYNTQYIKMTGNKNVWYPKNNCNSCFNSDLLKKGYTTMKQYTDEKYIKDYGDENQMNLF